MIFLGWVVGLFLLMGTPFLFEAGYLFWTLTLLVGYQFLGHRYYSENLSILAKPFQFLSYGVLFSTLLTFSNRDTLSLLFEFEKLSDLNSYTGAEVVYYFLGLLALIGMGTLSWIFSDKKTSLMKYMNLLPALVLLNMFIYYLEGWTGINLDWVGWILMNAFVLAFGISAMIYGHREKYMLPMFYGLFLVGFQLWGRYFDTDISFWLKGLIFLGVGGIFFFINYVVSEDVDTGEK
jgi:hypothetical protein